MAATWTAFTAWYAGIRIAPAEVVAIFLAVWILYAADRLLDARPCFTAPTGLHLEERHHFHDAHRKAFTLVAAAATIALALLLYRTAGVELHLYLPLAFLLSLWLMLVHIRPRRSAESHRLPKELAVGLFFPAAIAVPTVARAPALRPELLFPTLAFAVLCTLNTLFLFAWEHPGNADHAHPTTSWAAQRLTALGLLALAPGTLLLALGEWTVRRHSAQPLPHAAASLLASAVSEGLLLWLHASRRRTSPLTLRAAADLVLLTPAPLVLLICLAHHL